MNLGVRSVSLYVSDQERARRFWTETMGFDLVQEVPLGDDPAGPRWIEVAPPDRSVRLVLYTPPEHADRVGTFSNVIFHCDDVEAAYRELTARGVEFAEPPTRQFWGWWSVFRDPDGNLYGLGKRGE